MPPGRDIDVPNTVISCAKMLGDVALDHREAAVGQLVQRRRQDIALLAGGIGQPAKAVPDAALNQEFIVLDGKGNSIIGIKNGQVHRKTPFLLYALVDYFWRFHA